MAEVSYGTPPKATEAAAITRLAQTAVIAELGVASAETAGARVAKPASFATKETPTLAGGLVQAGEARCCAGRSATGFAASRAAVRVLP